MRTTSERHRTELHRLGELVEQARTVGGDGGLAVSMLEALVELVPCDQVSYVVMDPAREEAFDGFDVYIDEFSLEPDPDRLEALFWRTFWGSPACSYPQRHGDFTSVRRASDFHSTRDLAASPLGEYMRLCGMRHEAVMPLTPDGAVDHRLVLWRGEGPDFSDHEQLLLTLVRPHLAEAERMHRRPRSALLLTPRQDELLQLVAAGLTNRQIGGRLHISEGTVRRHLENIFDRLGVTSRTAAASHAVPADRARNAS